MREAAGNTGCERAADNSHDNRDRARGLMRDHSAFLAVGDDDVDRQPDQFSGHFGQPAGVPGGEPVLDRDVSAFDVAELAQSLAKSVEYPGRTPLRRRQDADAEGFPRLLRCAGPWRAGRHGNERHRQKRCGRAPHSMTSSARPRIDGGIVTPSVFAVFRLTTSS
jgi:hypothetical protein